MMLTSISEWSPEEDKVLREGVAKYGVKNWKSGKEGSTAKRRCILLYYPICYQHNSRNVFEFQPGFESGSPDY